MAISKIVKIRNIFATVKYCARDSKTNYGELISTYKCEMPFVARQFNEVTEARRKVSSRPFSVESWMIFQSFMQDEIKPEKAHELGLEFAKRYLGENHQYMVTTHIDSGCVHNHIVFNATDFVFYKSFDSRDKHIIQDLRNINDSLCKENNLSVIKELKGKGISQREYYARKAGHSYKARLEKMIDKAIENSIDFQDFLEIMDRNIEVRFGNILTFKFPEQKRPVRLTSLGIDYSENSIKYRIDNKEQEVKTLPSSRTLIDKNQSKFQSAENVGLRRWATRENIKTLATISHTLHQEGITYDEYKNRQDKSSSRLSDIGKKIEELDGQIAQYESYIKQETVYRSSYKVLSGYKNAANKEAYKKKHYADFKAYDKAKNFVSKFKNEGGKIPNPVDIREKIEDIQAERNILFTEYQVEKQRLSELISGASRKGSDETPNKRTGQDLEI